MSGLPATSSKNIHTFKANNFMEVLEYFPQSITFENSVGLENNGQVIAFLDEANHTTYYMRVYEQVVAFFDEANHTTYYKCVFKGYQDTLYIRGTLQFFKECDIYGSVDFICRNGLVVFQDCNIYARLLDTTMIAQSKSDGDAQSSFSFQNCNIMASPKTSKKQGTIEILSTLSY